MLHVTRARPSFSGDLDQSASWIWDPDTSVSVSPRPITPKIIEIHFPQLSGYPAYTYTDRQTDKHTSRHTHTASSYILDLITPLGITDKSFDAPECYKISFQDTQKSGKCHFINEYIAFVHLASFFPCFLCRFYVDLELTFEVTHTHHDFIRLFLSVDSFITAACDCFLYIN